MKRRTTQRSFSMDEMHSHQEHFMDRAKYALTMQRHQGVEASSVRCQPTRQTMGLTTFSAVNSKLVDALNLMLQAVEGRLEWWTLGARVSLAAHDSFSERKSKTEQQYQQPSSTFVSSTTQVRLVVL